MAQSNPYIIKKPFSQTANHVVKQLDSHVESGLSKKQVEERLTQFGKNEIQPKKPRTQWRILVDQFLNPIIYILSASALLAVLFKNWHEAIAILIVILITVAIGFFMELQAIHSMEALLKLGQIQARVLREGKVTRIKASDLVPGDVLILEAGDVVSADARLIVTENIELKEAPLTGESNPIEKIIDVISENTLLAEQNNMVFKGTSVSRGMAKAVVTATGTHTELGKIQQMGFETEKENTPLEKKLNELSKWLILLTLVICALIILTGYFRGQELILMIQTGIALAVASIPEGLPIVATIALAQGMLKLSKKQVIIKKLEAVQTLGATNIICTDKTGTLTEDEMKVHTLIFESKSYENVMKENNAFFETLRNEKAFEKMMMTSILCNDVLLIDEEKNGDAIDLALLEFSEFAGYNTALVKKNNPEKMGVAFDNIRKMMTTVNAGKQKFTIYTKGAFETVIDCCTTMVKDNQIENLNNKEQWHQLVNDLASQGLRTLAFAYRESEKFPEPESLFNDLTFIGIVGFLDPARTDVKSTIAIYKKAGIRVIMITGDHPGTAKKIAEEIGLLAPDTPLNAIIHGKMLSDVEALDAPETAHILNASVFARVSPKQKLDLITLFQKNNNIVGMIGDGINDVPALKKADIGIAMGIRGTEAAREAADVILKDDKFTSVELAIQQGRVIYENIRQFVVYLLSSNLAEIISVGLAALMNLPSPLMPLQILFLNLITDIFPALALGFGKGEKDIMEQPPRNPNEPILTKKLWLATLIYGLCMTASVVGITAYAYFVMKLPEAEINNLAFFTLIFAQLLNVFNMPKRHLSFFKNEVTANPWIWAAIAFSILLTASTYLSAPVAKALSLVPLSLDHLKLIVLFGFGSLALAQLIKRLGGTI